MNAKRKFLVLTSTNDGDLYNTFEAADSAAKEINANQESDVCEIYEVVARYAPETTTIYKKVPL